MKTNAIAVALIIAFAGAARAGDVSGYWRGELGSQAIELELRNAADGSIVGRLRSARSGSDIPLTGKMTGDTLAVEAPALGFTFSAILDDSELEGSASLGGVTYEAELERAASLAPDVRTQDPAPPFGYAIEDVAISGPEGPLAGTLLMPDGAGPHPAVLLLTPEGPQDRNAQAFAHRPHLVLADYLARAGFAVLRFDDRGVGGSAGTYRTATTLDFGMDAVAALAFLKARADIDGTRIAAAGRGNGASLAAIAAAGGTAAAVLISPSALVGKDALLGATAREMRANGDSEDDIAERVALMEQAFAVAADPSKSEADIRATVERLINDAAGLMSVMVPTEMIDGMTRQLAAPWFRHYLTYDPTGDYAQLRGPVLLLYGELDRANPPAENAAGVAAAAVGAKSETTILPGLNAALVTPPADKKATGFDRAETLSPAAMEAIANWLKTALAG